MAGHHRTYGSTNNLQSGWIYPHYQEAAAAISPFDPPITT